MPRQLQQQAGNLHESPFPQTLSPNPLLGYRKIKSSSSSAGAHAARPGSSPSPQRDGELSESAASWRMEITLAAARADSCSREGRNEAELPWTLGTGITGEFCGTSAAALSTAYAKPRFSPIPLNSPLNIHPGQVPQDGGNIGFL